MGDTCAHILGIIVGVLFLGIACIGFVVSIGIRKKHVEAIKQGAVNNNNLKWMAYICLLVASSVGGIGLVVLLHNIYTILEINNLMLRSAFESSDMFAAILAIISIIVGVMIFFVQEYNSELMELESAAATDQLNKYHQSVFKLDILREQNQLRKNLAIECNSMYNAILLETMQGETKAILYLETNLTGFAKNFGFPETVYYNVDNVDDSAGCKFVTTNQKQFQLSTASCDLFEDLFTAILNEEKEVTIQLYLNNVTCNNLKVPVIDINSTDLVAFVEKNCNFTLKQNITVKYVQDNAMEQAYFEILKIQSEIEELI